MHCIVLKHHSMQSFMSKTMGIINLSLHISITAHVTNLFPEMRSIIQHKDSIEHAFPALYLKFWHYSLWNTTKEKKKHLSHSVVRWEVVSGGNRQTRLQRVNEGNVWFAKQMAAFVCCEIATFQTESTAPLHKCPPCNLKPGEKPRVPCVISPGSVVTIQAKMSRCKQYVEQYKYISHSRILALFWIIFRLRVKE